VDLELAMQHMTELIYRCKDKEAVYCNDFTPVKSKNPNIEADVLDELKSICPKIRADFSVAASGGASTTKCEIKLPNCSWPTFEYHQLQM
jgi:hypothetical protein